MGGGIIVRLIDVVFILLFGFISVSQLAEKSQIDLPKSQEMPPTNPDPEIVVILGVTTSGLYLVENEKYAIDNLPQLRDYLSSKKEAVESVNQRIRVRIRANFDAPIKYTMRAADLCDELNIPKGIDVLRSAKKRV